MSSSDLVGPELSAQERAELENPKSFSSKFFTKGSFDVIPLKGNSIIVQWQSNREFDGSESDAPFKFVSTQCIGSTAYINGLGYGKGYCTYVTSDGDTLLGETVNDKVKIGKRVRQGRLNYIKGTGKLSGIKGYTDFTSIPLEAEGKNHFYNLVEAKTYYTLPQNT